MKKKLLFLIILTIMFIIPGVQAELDPNNFATIKVISDGTSDVDASDPANIVVSYKEGNLKWAPADPEIGRNADGWWIGIKITVPQNSGAFNMQKAQFKMGSTEEKMKKSTPVKFNDVKDSATHVNAWFRIDEQKLEGIKKTGGDYVAMIYEFDWNGDDEYEQRAIVKVDPDKIKFDDVDNEYAKVTVNSEKGNRIFTVKKGKSLNEHLTKEEKEVLNELMTAPKGKEFVGIFNGDKKFSLDTVINTDTVLTIKFEDENPQTNDNIMTFVTIGVLAIIGMVSSVYCLRKLN